MKKWIPLLALLLLLAGCTSSCGETEAKEPVQPEDSPSAQVSAQPTATPTASATPSAAPTVAPTPTPPPRQTEEAVTPTPDPVPTPTPTPTATPVSGPTDEEVLAAYREAQEAYSWFHLAPMPFDPEDSREVDGVVYYRVDYPGIDSLSTLRGYLKSLFSDAIVDSLLPYDGVQYLDIDGVLYVQDGGRGDDIYRGAEYTQVMRGDNPNRLVVRATVEVVDPEQNGAVTGSVTYEFPYEKVGEQWIFTDFSLVR